MNKSLPLTLALTLTLLPLQLQAKIKFVNKTNHTIYIIKGEKQVYDTQDRSIIGSKTIKPPRLKATLAPNTSKEKKQMGLAYITLNKNNLSKTYWRGLGLTKKVKFTQYQGGIEEIFHKNTIYIQVITTDIDNKKEITTLKFNKKNLSPIPLRK